MFIELNEHAAEAVACVAATAATVLVLVGPQIAEAVRRWSK